MSKKRGLRVSENFPTNQSTARRAATMLVATNTGFIIPTAIQKQNLLVAFAKKNMVIYGKAFDIVRLSGKVNLDDLADVERSLDKVTIFEIKSTKKRLQADFGKHFFSLTAAEMLVAQSLKKNFRFVFVSTANGNYLELGLVGIFAKARGIYPGWSICF